MADPDFQIRRGWGPRHPDPEIGGGCGLKKIWPFGPQFGLEIRGGTGPLSPSTRSASEVFIMTLHYLDGFSSFHRLLWRDASFTFTKQLLHKESDVATSNWNVLYTTTNDISLSL